MMLNTRVEFSIVIPMFNNSVNIVSTLDSCVKQSYKPKEIIIVDDCSADTSVEVVDRWIQSNAGKIDITLYKLEKNAGPSAARNEGWRLATGAYVAFLDADDIFTFDKLAVVNKVLLQYQNVVLLGHEYGVHKVKKKSSNPLKRLTTKSFLRKNYFTTSAVVVKREVSERFDKTMRYTEDQDLFLRLTKRYNKTYYLKEELVLRERDMNTGGGLSGNLWAMRSGEVKMYRKFCKANGLMVLFPIFLAYSLSKHLLKLLKGSV